MPATPSTFVPDYTDLLVQIMGESDDRYAALKTLHGPFGKWEHFRVSLVRSILLDQRTRPPAAGANNWTDKLLDAAAHNDPRYRTFLEDGAKQAMEYHQLAEQRGEQAAAAAGASFGGVR
jgi:hypothetical protein